VLGSLVSAVGLGGAAVFGWLRTKGLAVTLDADGFGIYGQLTTLAFYTGTVAAVGIGVGTTKMIAQARERKDAEGVGAALAISVYVALLGALVATVAIAGLAWWISPLLRAGDRAPLLILAAISIPFVALQLPLHHTLQAFEDARGQAAIYLVYGAAFTAAAVGAAAFAGVGGAVVALAAGNVLLAGLYALRARRLLRESGGRFVRGLGAARALLRSTLAGQLIRIGLASLAVLAVANVADVAVRTAVLHNEGETGAGHWHALTLVSVQLVGGVAGAVGFIMIPLVARAAARADDASIRGVLDHSVQLVLAVVVPLGVVLIALREPIATLLFSDDFRPIAQYLPLLTAGDIFRSVSWMLGAALVPLGLTAAWVAIGVGSSALFAAIGLLFVPRYGVGAAVVAWVAMWTLELAVTVTFLWMRRIWSPSARAVLAVALGAAAITAALAVGEVAGVAIAAAAAGVLVLVARGAR
jgi:O-antigen/teichoic acid export membrane protein